ncbi:Nucleic acid-binding, OB-fold [Sesbania bispinosa]|nr:Nucleic acid-binding, OB-fold [Sesbania bispinosa]
MADWSNKFVLLKDVDLNSEGCVIQPRVSRLWGVPDLKNSTEIVFVEIVFVDGQGCKIQASIMKELVHTFQNNIVEDATYLVRGFAVTRNVGAFKGTRHMYKLLFTETAEVVVTEAGMVTSSGFSPMTNWEIRNFKAHREYLVGALGMSYDDKPAAFPRRGVEVPKRDDFLIINTRKSILEIQQSNEAGLYIVFVRIVGFVEVGRWWYYACKCNRPVSCKSEVFYCSGCCRMVANVIPRVYDFFQLGPRLNHGKGIFVPLSESVFTSKGVSPMLYGIPSKRKFYGEGPSSIPGANRSVSIKIESDGCPEVAYGLTPSTQEPAHDKEVECDPTELNMSII